MNAYKGEPAVDHRWWGAVYVLRKLSDCEVLNLWPVGPARLGATRVLQSPDPFRATDATTRKAFAEFQQSAATWITARFSVAVLSGWSALTLWVAHPPLMLPTRGC